MNENDRVIVLVVDENYVTHAQALMANCYEQGGWRGSFCLVMPEGCPAAADFRRRGCDVYEVQATGFLTKVWLFSTYFRKWKSCLYMDCDCLVQGDLAKVFGVLDYGDLVVDIETNTVVGAFLAWDEQRDEPDHQALYTWLRENYEADEHCFNTSCMVWRPHAIPDDIVAKTMEIQQRLALINAPGKPGVGADEVPYPGGTDQQVLNLTLRRLVTPVRKRLFCYWALDEPEHRDDSQIPVVLHYARWYAPWQAKPTTDMGAYANHRLGRVCRELYDENVAKFNTLFP